MSFLLVVAPASRVWLSCTPGFHTRKFSSSPNTNTSFNPTPPVHFPLTPIDPFPYSSTILNTTLILSVPINTLNRQCSSGLTAIAQIANSIKSGEIDIGLAAGVEHMTAHYGAGVLPERMSDAVLSNPESADCLIPMGITSENVAKQYGVSRDVQDAFAAESFGKAAKAQKEGKFREEIVPVKVCPSDRIIGLFVRSKGEHSGKVQ